MCVIHIFVKSCVYYHLILNRKYLLFSFIFILISTVSISLYVAIMVICLHFYLLLVIYVLSVTGHILVLYCYSHISNSVSVLQFL
jgi:hypothetical protein